MKIKEETQQEDKNTRRLTLEVKKQPFFFFLYPYSTYPNGCRAGATLGRSTAHEQWPGSAQEPAGVARDVTSAQEALFFSSTLICPADIFPPACKHGHKHMNV